MRLFFILLITITLAVIGESWTYQSPQIQLHLVDIDNGKFDLKSGAASLNVFKKETKNWEMHVAGKRYMSEAELVYSRSKTDSTVLALDFSKAEVPAEFNEIRKTFKKGDRLMFRLSTLTSTGKTNELKMHLLIQ